MSLARFSDDCDVYVFESVPTLPDMPDGHLEAIVAASVAPFSTIERMVCIDIRDANAYARLTAVLVAWLDAGAKIPNHVFAAVHAAAHDHHTALTTGDTTS